ncbi:hypothetical protein V0288_19735 [Pannus brasiliensis CCIBt3594]|uniref:Uncharacterized protein n=1 Tax=Pannus brasiliensis CCIBt3594 TaxID=1427578 RepID=A0AAW9QZF4_9CHRO
MTGLQNTLGEDDKKANSKDKWDIIKLIAPLVGSAITGGLGAYLGVYNTLNDYYFKQREAITRTVEVAEKFMPYLIGNVDGAVIPEKNREDAKKTTIIMIASLGENNLAINLARLYPTMESIQYLKTIILQGVAKLSSLDTISKDKTSIENEILEAIDATGEIAKILISPNPSDDHGIPNILQKTHDRIEKILCPRQQANSENSCSNSNFESIDKKIREVQQEIDKIKPEFNKNAKLAIVISSDTSLEAAQFEQRRAESLQKQQADNQFKGDIVIYKRKEWYATIVKNVDQNQQTLENALNFWRDNFRSSSFMVDFKDWCPIPQNNAKGFSECK